MATEQQSPPSAGPSKQAAVQRPEWGDARKVYELFGIGRSTLYRLADAGRITTTSLRERGCVRGKRLFFLDSIAELLESRATGGKGGAA